MSDSGNDVLIRVFATLKTKYCVVEWWLEGATEGRRMVFDTYNEAVAEALVWKHELSRYGLTVVTDKHIHKNRQPTQWTSRVIEPTKTDEQLYDEMMGQSTVYGALIW